MNLTGLVAEIHARNLHKFGGPEPKYPPCPLAYSETIEPGRAGYAPTAELVRAIRDGKAARAWRLGARVVSVQLGSKYKSRENNGIWKAAERLPLADPARQLADLEAIGVPHPSSFSACYHALAPKTKPLKLTFHRLFDWWQGGPWHEARMTGEFRGTWYRYDLASAYRWAATLGLPDARGFHVTTGPIAGPGMWVVRILSDTRNLPAVFRTSEPVVMSSEEIDGYKIRVELIRGVRWSILHPTDYVESTLLKLPCPKEAGRAYWGRWIARDPVVAWTPAKEWELRNIFANFIWGWLIVGRVRFRLWQAAPRAAHVYVDEMVVPHQVETGTGLGSWHLKEVYPRGIAVHRTGHFGPRRSAPSMHTGVSSNGKR